MPLTSNQTDSIEALNLIPSARIHELYKSQDVEDPLVLRKKAAAFRKGYTNWRKSGSKGARGETNYLLDKESLHASELRHEQIAEASAALELQNILFMEKVDEEIEDEVLGSPRQLSASRQLSRRSSLRDLWQQEGDVQERITQRSGSFHENELEHNDPKEHWLKFYVNPYSGMEEAREAEPIALNQANLKKIRSVFKPTYPRLKEKGVDFVMCHMGVGGFSRSHQFVYTDDLLEKEQQGPRWGICGIGLMEWDRKMYETLKEQDYMYTLLSRGRKSSEARIIGSIIDYIFAPDDHEACIAKLADSKTRIVSLTITEKGYCQDNQGDLDTNNPFVKSDIEGNLQKPKTAIGMIVAGLRRRMENGEPSFTVLSCDNLPENGDKVERCVLQMAGHINSKLKEWIHSQTKFPNTMVDRITPLTEQEHKDLLARDYMVLDGWPVIAEDFRQWVVEDKFCCGRPAWEKVGALMVEEVRPYEFMKLRLLNGGHSALSYAGYLSGFHYVDDAMCDPVVNAYIAEFFHQVIPTLSPVPGVSMQDYCDQLIARFCNPYIKDNLTRLHEDGSKKMPNTMRDAIINLSERGLSTTTFSLAHAAWIQLCTGHDLNDEPCSMKDPMAEQLKKLARATMEDPSRPSATAFLMEVHGQTLTNIKSFVTEVEGCLRDLRVLGAKAVLESVVQGSAVVQM